MDEEEETPEVAGLKSGGSKNMLVLILVGVNVLVTLGAGAGIFLMMSNQPSGGAAAEPEPEPTEIGPMQELPALVVNLADQGESRFVRAGFYVELDSEDHQSVFEERKVPLRSAMILHLSALTAEQLQGGEARQALLTQLKELANETLGGGFVRRMYVSELVVQ